MTCQVRPHVSCLLCAACNLSKDVSNSACHAVCESLQSRFRWVERCLLAWACQVVVNCNQLQCILCSLQAARAVASCLTPGLPPLVHVSIQPRGQHMSRITFLPQARPAVLSAQRSVGPTLLHAESLPCLPICCLGGHEVCMELSGHQRPDVVLLAARSLASMATSITGCMPATPRGVTR